MQVSLGGAGLPPAIAGLLASLPKEGEGWTQDRRDKFVNTFGAVIDFCFPIVAAEQPKASASVEEMLG